MKTLAEVYGDGHILRVGSFVCKDGLVYAIVNSGQSGGNESINAVAIGRDGKTLGRWFTPYGSRAKLTRADAEAVLGGSLADVYLCHPDGTTICPVVECLREILASEAVYVGDQVLDAAQCVYQIVAVGGILGVLCLNTAKVSIGSGEIKSGALSSTDLDTLPIAWREMAKMRPVFQARMAA